MSPSKTLYISIDVEADGPIPGDNSMLSFGAAAFHLDHFEPGLHAADSVLSTFEANLDVLESAERDEGTMAWWAKNPEAYEETRRDTQDPQAAMLAFWEWVEHLAKVYKAKPVIVGYPVTYDFMFVYWYSVHFIGFPTPFGFQGFDIKTLAAERLGVEFKQAAKRRMPKRWFIGCPKHTHVALDDAIGQGVLLMNILTDKS